MKPKFTPRHYTVEGANYITVDNLKGLQIIAHYGSFIKPITSINTIAIFKIKYK